MEPSGKSHSFPPVLKYSFPLLSPACRYPGASPTRVWCICFREGGTCALQLPSSCRPSSEHLGSQAQRCLNDAVTIFPRNYRKEKRGEIDADGRLFFPSSVSSARDGLAGSEQASLRYSTRRSYLFFLRSLTAFSFDCAAENRRSSHILASVRARYSRTVRPHQLARSLFPVGSAPASHSPPRALPAKEGSGTDGSPEKAEHSSSPWPIMMVSLHLSLVCTVNLSPTPSQKKHGAQTVASRA